VALGVPFRTVEISNEAWPGQAYVNTKSKNVAKALHALAIIEPFPRQPRPVTM
jgi:hypothetical protein